MLLLTRPTVLIGIVFVLIINGQLIRIHRNVAGNKYSNSLYTCEFNLTEEQIFKNESGAVFNKSTRPNIIWSHLGDSFVRKIYSMSLPNYPNRIILHLNRVQVNLRAGILYNHRGCILSQAKYILDGPLRKHFRRPKVIPDSEPMDIPVAIYMWGSRYSSDWQHTVIDFLPLFDQVLGLIKTAAQTSREDALTLFDIPIISGSYSRLFKNMFPFSLFQFLDRNADEYVIGDETIQLRRFPTSFEELYYIDLDQRDQSYVYPEAFARLLPFLLPEFQYDANLHTRNYLIDYLLHRHSGPSRQSVSRPSTVVFLDRNSLFSDEKYLEEVGRPFGRDLENQTELLRAIRGSLKASHRLVVHSCKDWEVDRKVLGSADVVIGVHGGHLANM
jgi:hypothetical protein